MLPINEKKIIITILGPTAGGKTNVAAHLAKYLHGEIISADSRQIYRKMNLGTGKDYDDYTIDGVQIPYHLIDIKEPGYKYNLFEYQQDFYKVYKNITERNKIPILCGGTGLYIEGVTKGYKMLAVPPDEKLRKELESKSLSELESVLKSYKTLHNISDIDTKKRAIRAIEIEKYHEKYESNLPVHDLKPIYFGIKYDRISQRKRITDRLKSRLESGMIDEVRDLLEMNNVPSDSLVYYGLEYKFITLYLLKEITYDEMFIKLNTAIHQFAKRQMTWFRRMERKGDKIYWFDGYEPNPLKIKRMLEILEKEIGI